VPGYLSFREAPALLAALGRLHRAPDVILCDGQGLAHPRRFGLACHLGVLLDVPTIGVAKSRLIGTHDEPAPRRGARTPLRDAGETIGAVLRTRAGVRPVYVSVGHRVSLETAIAIVLGCAPRFRVPEPVRRADGLASRRARRRAS
jgi:deoxyribonuclease V